MPAKPQCGIQGKSEPSSALLQGGVLATSSVVARIPYNKRYRRLLLLIIAAFIAIPALCILVKRVFEIYSPNLRVMSSTDERLPSLHTTTAPLDFLKRARTTLLTNAKECDYFMRGDFLGNRQAIAHPLCGGAELRDPLRASLIGLLPQEMANLSLYAQKREWARTFGRGFRNERYGADRMKKFLDQTDRADVATLPQAEVPIEALKKLVWRVVKEGRIEPGSSRINCGVVDADIPQRYCDIQNVAIKLDMLPPVEKRNGLDLLAPFGTLESTCHLRENEWFGRSFGGGAAGWMFDGLEILDPKENVDIKCDAWIETPIFFLSRWDTTNPYQFHQDAFNTFLVYSLLNLDASVVQPVILDSRRADGPFTTAWSHLFSTSRHLIDVRQIASSVRAELVRTGWAGTRSPQVCLRKAVWGVHGGVSPLSRGGNKKTTCKNAPFLFAFRDFVLARVWEIVGRPSHHQTEWLPLPVKGRNGDEFLEEKVWSLVAKSALLADEDTRGLAREMAVKTLVVTYAIRQRPSRRGPNGGSNLDATQIHGLEGIQLDAAAAEVVGDVDPLKRVFANQQDVVDKLRNFVHAWARQSARYGIQVDFRAIDFATLSFEEQLAIAHGTDFFIGPHGAVFAHLLYLRQMPMAAVLELKPPERGNGNQQFHNLAVKMGNLYQAAPISSTLIDDKQMKFIMEIVQEMLDQLQAARLNSLK